MQAFATNAARWLATHPRILDGGVALAAFVVSVVGLSDGGGGQGRGGFDDGFDVEPGRSTVWVVVVLVVGCGALVARRAAPRAVWGTAATAVTICTVLGSVDPTTSAPLLVALFTVGRLGTIPATVGVWAIGGVVYLLAQAWTLGSFLDERGDSPALTVLALTGAAAAAGVAIRGQRSALEAARARAQQAEATREEEATRRVTDERLRIARELHDVVAHHISVVNVQAGVARHLLTSNPAQAREALTLVRDASKTVISELSSVLGLLRTADGDAPAEPAPGLAQLPRLLASVQAAGLHVDREERGTPEQLAPVADLTAYRVIQEGLTNALKYGSGRASLVIDHTSQQLGIQVRNTIAATAADSLGGHGLMGIRERVDAVRGWSTAGPDPDAPADWVLRAGIPKGHP